MMFVRISYPAGFLALFAIILSGSARAEAQQQSCNLKLDQLPNAAELFGFRLGMTPEEAKARVPQIMFGRADQLGVVKTSISPSYDPRFNQAAFVGVRTISFDFLDGRLVGLWIGYDEKFKWQTPEKFIAGITKSLNLSGEWLLKRGGRELTCAGFSVFVSTIAGSPSIRITEDAAQETIATRRDEAVAAQAVVVADKNTKLYYPSDCEAAQTISDSNRMSFKDKDQAEKAGYKLAKDCQ